MFNLNNCSLTSLKQYLNFTEQKSVKRKDISCKVTFGFKHIMGECEIHTKIHFVNITARNGSLVICEH